MDNILIGLTQVFSPGVFSMILAGVLVGLVIGAIPGLTTNMAIAIMVPITYTMSAPTAMAFLVAIYCAGSYGGSISAILIGIPGTGAAVCTTIDGHPLAQKGKAGLAIYLATLSSVFGGVASTLVLLLAAPLLAAFAIRFGPGEFLALFLFGVISVASMSGSKSLLRGLLSGFIGLLFATVGISSQTGSERYTFGLYEIIDGFPLVPVFIGLFGLGSVLASSSVATGDRVQEAAPRIGKMLYSIKTWLQYWVTIIRSAVIGIFIGILPGPGEVAAAFLSYDQAKRNSKHPETFGKGEPEGVVAPETANNSVVGGSMVPLMALGVPGNSVSALFLGALLLHGLLPGPALFRDTPEVAYGLIIAMFFANLLMAPLGLLLGRMFTHFLRVPRAMLQAIIIALCLIGTFSIRNNVGDIYVMIGFGILSYFMKRVDMPVPPLVLGIILGPLLEKVFFQSVTVFEGNFSFLVTRPIALLFILFACWSLGKALRDQIKARKGSN